MIVDQSARVTLVVGFKGLILQALHEKFNIKFTISLDPEADLEWFDCYYNRRTNPPSVIDDQLLDCLAYVKKYYVNFNDINSRRYYYVSGRESETYNGFMLTFYNIYEIIKKNKIELVLFANIPHEGFDYIIYLVAKYLGLTTLMCYQSLIPNRFWLTHDIDLFGNLSNLPKISPYERSNYQIPSQWFYMKGVASDSSYSFKQACFEVLRKPYRLPVVAVRYVYGRQYRDQQSRLLCEFDPTVPYIYFPLHLQPELTTSALGGFFSDQLLVVEWLSKWLPEGIVLYLKENPKQTEKQRDPMFYKRLTQLHNVKLLSTKVSSSELILHAKGVATVTGTAGWEALFQNKPVLVFGKAWYRKFPGVTEFSSNLHYDTWISSLPGGATHVIDALDHALEHAGKGIVDQAYTTLVSDFDEKKNSLSVVESIAAYLNALAT